MKNVKKILLSALAAMICMGAIENSALAFETRLKSMGMDEFSYWMIQKDEEYAIYYNPSLLSGIKPLITAKYETNPYGAIIINPMNKLNLAFSSGEDIDSNDGTGTDDFPQIDGTGIDSATLPLTMENYSLLGSYSMGKMGFGMQIGYATTKDIEGGVQEDTKSIINTKLGFNMALGSGMDFDVALGLTMYNYKSKDLATGDSLYSANPNDIRISGRFNKDLSETNKLHVFAGLLKMDRSDKILTTKVDKKGTDYAIGVSDEMNFSQSSLVYAGLMILKGGWETSSGGVTFKQSYSVVRFSLGFEANLTKNLIGRAGAYRNLNISYESEIAGVKSESGLGGNTNVSAGLAYQLGNVLLEANLFVGLFNNGPHFIGGVPNTGFSSQFQATYTFDTKSSFEGK